MMPEFLKVPQVAKQLGIDNLAVRNEMKRGKLKCKRIGTLFVTRQIWLDQYINQPDNAKKEKFIVPTGNAREQLSPREVTNEYLKKLKEKKAC